MAKPFSVVFLSFIAAILLLSSCSSSNKSSINKIETVNSTQNPTFAVTGGPGVINEVNLANFSIDKTINLNTYPSGSVPNLVVDPATNTAYIELQTQLESLNLSNLKSQTFSFAKLPTGLASFFSTANSTSLIYTVDNLSGQIVSFNPENNSTTKTPIQFAGSGAFLSPNQQLLAALEATPFNSQTSVYFFQTHNLSQSPIVINVGNEPEVGGVFSPDSSTFYLLEESHGQVPGYIYPISLTTGRTPQVGAPLAVGQLPSFLAISPDGKTLAVANANGQISVVNLTSFSITNSLNINADPTWLSFMNNQDLLITTDYPSELIKLDITTGQTIDEIQLTYQPDYFTIGTNNTLYVISDNSKGIVYSISKFSSPIAIGAGVNPSVIAGKVGQPVWVVDDGNSTASLLNPNNTLKLKAQICLNPVDATESPSGTYLYVLCNPPGGAPGILERISTSGQTTAIEVGHVPTSVAVTPDDSKIYVSNALDNNVDVISASTFSIIATVTVGGYPTQLTVLPDSAYVYVLNSADNTLSKINASNEKVTATITVGSSPYLVPTPDGSALWIINQSDESMESISTTSNNTISQVQISGNPVQAVITPDGKYIVLVDDLGNDLQEYSATNGKFLIKVPLDITPTALAVSPSGSFVFSADLQNGEILVSSLPNLNPVSTIKLNVPINELLTMQPVKSANFTTTTGI